MENLDSVLQRFKRHCEIGRVPLPDYQRGVYMIIDDAQQFDGMEASRGDGKTRRPTMNTQYFDGILLQVAELRRRETEDEGYLFGEDGRVSS